MNNLSWQVIRGIRNKCLSNSDWTQLNDVNLDDDLKKQWADYRQQLRDITKNFRIPNEVVWPSSPNSNE